MTINKWKCENNFWAVVCAIKRGQCRRRTKQWAPHPGAICSPCPKQTSAHQCESKADQCVPRHTTVFAPTFLPNPPLFVRQLHIPCSLEFPRQDSARTTSSFEPTTFLQHPTAPLWTLEPVWGAGHFPLSSSLLFCHKTESRQSLSPPVPKKLQSTDAR